VGNVGKEKREEVRKSLKKTSSADFYQDTKRAKAYALPIYQTGIGETDMDKH
jgi:hypothetical protein